METDFSLYNRKFHTQIETIEAKI